MITFLPNDEIEITAPGSYDEEQLDIKTLRAVGSIKLGDAYEYVLDRLEQGLTTAAVTHRFNIPVLLVTRDKCEECGGSNLINLYTSHYCGDCHKTVNVI
jgi:hypothetical protein